MNARERESGREEDDAAYNWDLSGAGHPTGPLSGRQPATGLSGRLGRRPGLCQCGNGPYRQPRRRQVPVGSLPADRPVIGSRVADRVLEL